MAFPQALDSLTWVAFAPTDFDPRADSFPSESSIRTDLERLHAAGFDGVITFASDGSLAQVPRIARDVGFRGVITGLFLGSPAQRAVEVPNAVAAAEHTTAYALGNEGLEGCGGTLYDEGTLRTVAAQLATTGRPVTTSEQIEDYLEGCLDGFLLDFGAFLFPIIHPFNQGIRDPAAGVAFTVDRFTRLQSLTTKPVLVKETGWPTCGDPAANQAQQESYFSLLGSAVDFAFFEAFDQPFKESITTPWEACWGLFDTERQAKGFIDAHRP